MAPKAGTGCWLPVPGPSSSPEPQDDAAPAAAREALGLPLGVERGAQDRQDLADRRVLGHRAVGRIDEGDGGLDVDCRPGRERRVDEDPRSVRTEPVVLAPGVRVRELLERADPGRQVQDAIHPAHGFGDRGGIEEVELRARRHRDLVAGCLREGPQRAAEHPGSPGDQQAQR